MYAINKQRSLEVSTGEQSWIRDCPEGDSERVIGKLKQGRPILGPAIQTRWSPLQTLGTN